MSKRADEPASPAKGDPILTPASSSSPSSNPQRLAVALDFDEPALDTMDSARVVEDQATADVTLAPTDQSAATLADGKSESGAAGKKAKPHSCQSKTRKTSQAKAGKKKGKKKKNGKAAGADPADSDSSVADASDSDDDDDDSDTDSEDSDDDSSSPEDQKKASKRKDQRRKHKAQRKTKATKSSKSKSKAKASKASKLKKAAKHSPPAVDSSSDDSDDNSSDDSLPAKRKKKSRARRSRKRSESDSSASSSEQTSWSSSDTSSSSEDNVASLKKSIHNLTREVEELKASNNVVTAYPGMSRRPVALPPPMDPPLPDPLGLGRKINLGRGKLPRMDPPRKKKGRKAATKLEFKRVDQLWDTAIHNYKLKESVEDEGDEFAEFVFTVRRKFDWENKYRNTVIDIKSKPLRDALQEIMKDVKGVSLVEEQPCVDPNMLFLYLDELKEYTKKTIKQRIQTTKKRKQRERLEIQKKHCKVMINYLKEDYAETERTLKPMLAAGNITFDLLWALFKPNSIAYTSTYGNNEDPRCFKVDYANKESSFMRGEWYCIEGRYLEYDGKNFGLGDFEIHVEAFKGARKISGLATYPLEYHKDADALRTKLIDRGKRFVAMQGMNYRFHKGLAFMKKKKAVAKVNINGRIMIDPAIFRRINPNYPISSIKPKDEDLFPGDDENECSDCDCQDNDDDEVGAQMEFSEEKEEVEKTKLKVVFDKDKKPQIVEVPVDEKGRELHQEKLDQLNKEEDTEPKKLEFTEEELLIASPVVLGFSFSEKLWLEFSLSGVRDIEWNNQAFESLVLPPNQKSIVKALVSSHKFHAAETIDDVVQGKGKGLVFVLHGPPGVGKTLTGEGIAEFLKCPLYAVSAGELGTDSRVLEHELQKIMDIAHSWGAVLLLDEADVFLEKREVHDIHRNALVSIFLRLLEYFQGILFLTTNRVGTFDEAFQSRIHVALRYEDLSTKAKKEIWKMFLERVRVMEGIDTMPFKESDYDALARHDMNGRQIKNAVRTAQALAVNEKQKLSLEHIKRVLDVAESFERDLKGGTGYMDAMRSYT